MISVVLPTFNRAYCLGRAIMSVLNQSYRDLELIVVDDHSSDDTLEIVHSIRDSRLRYFRLRENKGAAYARNFGISNANSSLIAFQDSDDVWEVGKLKAQLELLSKLPQEYAMVFCSLKRNYGKERVVPPLSIRLDPKHIYNKLKKANFISNQTILCKKRALISVGCFDEQLPALQDWDLALRIAKSYKIYHQREVHVSVNISENSITNDKHKTLDARKYLLNKHESNLSIDELHNWQYSIGKNAMILRRHNEALKYFELAMDLKSRRGLLSTCQFIRLKLFA